MNMNGGSYSTLNGSKASSSHRGNLLVSLISADFKIYLQIMCHIIVKILKFYHKIKNIENFLYLKRSIELS